MGHLNFAASPTVGAKPPTLQDATCTTETNEPIGLCQVGEGRLVHCAGPRMTDDDWRAAIARAEAAEALHEALWKLTNCFVDKGNADRAKLSKVQLIAGRKAAA